jgi:pimeloyl-ACP methyl ester carboxylesterase
MEKVRSADGTEIAFEKVGSGPPVVLVGGALCDRRARVSGLPLAKAMASAMTVYAYDRRGRGDSSDTAPYSVAREIEDLAALLALAGSTARVYGHSSGAILALEAALTGLSMQQLALYEPPLILHGLRERMPSDLEQQLVELSKAGKRSEATALFLTQGVGVPAAVVEQRKLDPSWAKLEALAHTLSYDARLTADPESIVTRAASLRVPAALFDGGRSQAWLRAGVDTLSAALPAAPRVSLPEQTHDVDPLQLAPKLLEFFLR